MNNDDISHFSTIPASFAIKTNVYFLTHQYLIINNSQSQRALSVSMRTVLWIYFSSRRNCGLLPIRLYDFLSRSPIARLAIARGSGGKSGEKSGQWETLRRRKIIIYNNYITNQTSQNYDTRQRNTYLLCQAHFCTN